VGPFGGFVGFPWSNVSLGACGTEVYSSPPLKSDVVFEVFLRKVEGTPGVVTWRGRRSNTNPVLEQRFEI
jgi:hypothetical protein